MDSDELDILVCKYIDLWESRKSILETPTDAGWKTCHNLSASFHNSIAGFFYEIEQEEDGNKRSLVTKLKSESKKLMEGDHLFKEIRKQFESNDTGLRKYLYNIALSTRSALINGISEIEFTLEKEDGKCNCQLKQNLNLSIRSIPNPSLSFIKESDSYESTDLYQCKECKIYWINDQYSGDGPSVGWRKLKSKYEFELVVSIEES